MRISPVMNLLFVLLLLCSSAYAVFASMNPNDKTKESILFSSPADSWEEISKTDEDVWHIDVKSVSHKKKGMVTVTAKRAPVKGSKSLATIQEVLRKGGKDAASYSFTKIEFEINCSKNAYRVLKTRHFDVNEKEIEAFKYPNAEWKPVEPDSVPEYMKTDLCPEEKKTK